MPNSYVDTRKSLIRAAEEHNPRMARNYNYRRMILVRMKEDIYRRSLDSPAFYAGELCLAEPDPDPERDYLRTVLSNHTHDLTILHENNYEIVADKGLRLVQFREAARMIGNHGCTASAWAACDNTKETTEISEEDIKRLREAQALLKKATDLIYERT